MNFKESDIVFQNEIDLNDVKNHILNHSKNAQIDFKYTQFSKTNNKYNIDFLKFIQNLKILWDL